MKVTIEMTEEEAAEYLRYKKFKGREAEEINELGERLYNLAEHVYRSIMLSEESGEVEIINGSYARAAIMMAEKVLY